ncbi:MAG: sigma-70 family RNA polymerase sigma factor [Eubacteriales bacterium]|nr:sigma-70 family RNA polymerase sigma factor [Eubacteriales bacterium]
MSADDLHVKATQYVQSPTEESLDTAVKAGLPLAYAIAVRFRGRGIELEDLKQVAAMALVEALKRFEPERGLRFSTFAMPTITGKVRNYIRDKANILRSPRTLRENGIKMDRANAELTQRLRREPSVQELAEYLGWEVEQVLDIETMRDRTSVASLDTPDEDGMYLYDRVGEEDISFKALEAREDLKKALTILSPQEKALLSYRYSSRLSQNETGKKLGMSQMQVSRMERRILSTLRERLQNG